MKRKLTNTARFGLSLDKTVMLGASIEAENLDVPISRSQYITNLILADLKANRSGNNSLKKAQRLAKKT